MEFAGTDEMDKYRKYIQKRRLSPLPEDGGDEKPKPDDADESVHSETESVFSDPYSSWNERESNSTMYGEDDRRKPAGYGKTGSVSKAHNAQTASLPVLHRTDMGLYKKLYSNSGHKSPAYSTPYKGYSGSRTEIEDNRVATLAVKLIKQALACFAVLGIIILMQSRPDMKEVLAVVKKQVVETNIEPQSLYEGIKDIVDQCARALGGSP